MHRKARPYHGKAMLLTLGAGFFLGAIVWLLGLELIRPEAAGMLFHSAGKLTGGGEGASMVHEFAPLARRVLPAIARVEAFKAIRPARKDGRIVATALDTGGEPEPPGRSREAGKREAGSGVLVGAAGPVLTSSRLVEGATAITVTLNDGRRLQAGVIGVDPATDIAVLAVKGSNLPCLKFGDSSKLEVGDIALAFGSPLESTEAVSVGIVSSTAESSARGPLDLILTIQSSGSSPLGAALVNRNGDLVGIQTAVVDRVASRNIGYAVPGNVAREVMNQIVSHGRVDRSWLGAPVTASTQEAGPFGAAPGALVGEVEPGSPAALSGLSKGDRILEIDGKPVKDGRELGRRITMYPRGSTIELKVCRNGRERTISVTLSAPPPKASPGYRL